MRIYAMEYNFLNQLLEDRKELFAFARNLKTAEEMRMARKDLIESLSSINLTPKNSKEAKDTYTIDSEGIAHIPITGELTPKAETDACGGYTANALTEYGFIISASIAADQNEKVNKIQYEINSPGGYVDGLMDAVNTLRIIEKETISNVHDMAASAAYFLASQTDKIIANSIMSRVGSIGIAMEEYDDTKMLEDMGVTRRVYTSTDAPDKRPDTSTKEGQKKVIAELDDLHNVFVKFVSEGRNTDKENINKNYGRGGLVIAEKALKAGMIDQITNIPARIAEDIADVAGKTAAKTAKKQNEGEPMTIQILKTDNPEVYAEAVNIGVMQGVEQERKRVAKLQSYKDADPENLKLAEVIDTAISDGSTADDMPAKIQIAIRDGKALDGENAPAIKTAEGLDLSPEDREAAKLAGMTDSEYKKWAGV